MRSPCQAEQRGQERVQAQQRQAAEMESRNEHAVLIKRAASAISNGRRMPADVLEQLPEPILALLRSLEPAELARIVRTPTAKLLDPETGTLWLFSPRQRAAAPEPSAADIKTERRAELRTALRGGKGYAGPALAA